MSSEVSSALTFLHSLSHFICGLNDGRLFRFVRISNPRPGKHDVCVYSVIIYEERSVDSDSGFLLKTTLLLSKYRKWEENFRPGAFLLRKKGPKAIALVQRQYSRHHFYAKPVK